MANVTFDAALGRVREWVLNPAPNSAFILVPLEAAGLIPESLPGGGDDGNRPRRLPTLAALLATTINEQTTMGRKTLENVVAGGGMWIPYRWVATADPVTYTAPTGNPIGAVVVCYVPDTLTESDATTIPVSRLDMVATPDGEDIVFVFPENGFYAATQATPVGGA